jgi:hypothetical protein
MKFMGIAIAQPVNGMMTGNFVKMPMALSRPYRSN